VVNEHASAAHTDLPVGGTALADVCTVPVLLVPNGSLLRDDQIWSVFRKEDQIN